MATTTTSSALAFSTAAFKAYDVRGIVPDQLNPLVCQRLVWALVTLLAPKSCVIGWDVRAHSPQLVSALTDELLACGCDVVHLGLAGTEEVYFHTGHNGFDLGLMVTASHNPAEYNGIKITAKGATPMVGAHSMEVVKQLAERLTQRPELTQTRPGRLSEDLDKSAYIDRLMEFVDPAKLKPLKIAMNSGNGVAGPVVEALKARLPQLEILHIHAQPDGSFPNGIPNPMIEEKRAATRDPVIEHGCDLGIAFDGDFDRCFFFDETGAFIDGAYVVSLLAQSTLAARPGAGICFDPRIIWNNENQVKALGGQAHISKSGHTFVKASMRETKAVYGGELSAHHYFADFYYCDSGMIPWLLMAQLIATSGQSLGDLVRDMQAAHPTSGEINFKFADKDSQLAAIARVRGALESQANAVSELDGLSLSFGDRQTAGSWRMNLRMSNTEPLLRLCVESVQAPQLLAEKTAMLKGLIEG